VATRFDARVKVELPAMVASSRGETEHPASVTQLSLGGLLLEGRIPAISDTFFIKLKLPQNEEVELYGDILRKQNGGSATRFYLPEKEITKKLWGYIAERITYRDVCPYCNHPALYSDHCQKCGSYLNFADSEYLDKHLRETFLQRVKSRTEWLNPEQMFKVLNFVDRELLLIKGRFVDEQFVGTSPKMHAVFSMIRKVAPTDNSVLILGESGTGKELAAKAIYERSPRANRPFIVINCAAIPETLLEAELFGYEKGAFTGAYMSKKGKFELAHGGTVFLDEIGEMPLSLQAKLLRVLENSTMERLGGGTIKVDVRIIASTNRELAEEVRTGRFRLDLYHRINTFTIFLPSLRDRGEDKIILAKHYLKRICLSEGVSKQFSKDAIEDINSYPWPGNVRELINKIRRAVVLSENAVINSEDLFMETPEKNIMSLKEARSSIEKQKLLEVIETTTNNLSKAAAILGISRPTIYSLMKKYGITLKKD